jgi:hypothetical protein
MKKILYVDFGGLGDHLAWSTIPKICHENGYDFYLSSKSKFRSKEILDLVWNSNPFFKGIIDDEPNCGHDNYTNLENFNYQLSIHRNMEIKMGFEHTTTTDNSKYGTIHYHPKNLENFNDHILIDLNSVSTNDYNIEIIKTNLLQYFDQKIICILPTYSTPFIDIEFFKNFNVDFVLTKNIYHYCDLIFSSKKFICLWSGGSVLSPIIKNQYKKNLEIDCFKNYNATPNFGFTDKTHFWYENINYIRA